MLDGVYLVVRQQTPGWLRALTYFAGIAWGICISVAILLASGISIGDFVNEFIVFVFFDEGGLSQTRTSFIPLGLGGLAAAAAIKLRFWNVGVEGQMWVGAIAGTFVATYDVGPDSMRLPLMFLAAAIAGSLWIGFPALLKLRYGVNEIITTLLLSYVAQLMVQNLLFGIWRDPVSGFPASPLYDPDVEQLGKLGWGSLHSGLWIALGAGVVCWWLMNVSRFGFFMDCVGANPVAAKASGLPVVATIVGAVVVSGGLAGVAGLVIVAGVEYRLTVHIAEGFTFSSIVLAFVARFNPIGVLVVAVIIGGYTRQVTR
jgi:simple sugar transport system permease protein